MRYVLFWLVGADEIGDKYVCVETMVSKFVNNTSIQHKNSPNELCFYYRKAQVRKGCLSLLPQQSNLERLLVQYIGHQSSTISFSKKYQEEHLEFAQCASSSPQAQQQRGQIAWVLGGLETMTISQRNDGGISIRQETARAITAPQQSAPDGSLDKDAGLYLVAWGVRGKSYITSGHRWDTIKCA